MYTVIHGRYIYIYANSYYMESAICIYIYGMTSFYTYTYIYTRIYFIHGKTQLYMMTCIGQSSPPRRQETLQQVLHSLGGTGMAT